MSLSKQIFARLPKHLPKIGKFSSYGLLFDGVEDLVTILASASINDLSAFTYEAWLRYAAYTNYPRIMEKSAAKSFQITTGNILRGYIGAATTSADNRSKETVPANEWTLVHLTYDDSGDRYPHLYMNAVECTYQPGYPIVAEGALISDATANLIIGNRATGDRPLSGVLDEIRIFNRVLSINEMRESFRRGYALHENGCVLALDMEEGGGSTIYDKSGNDNHGTLSPAPTWRLNQLFELLVESGQ